MGGTELYHMGILAYWRKIGIGLALSDRFSAREQLIELGCRSFLTARRWHCVEERG